MLENILSTIGWFVVGIVMGRMILRWLILPLLQAQQDREEQEIAQLSQRLHIVKQEIINDIIYWYDNDDGTFLAQGRDHDEIVAVLEQRFPQHIFVINETQMIMGPKFNEILKFDELTIKREN